MLAQANVKKRLFVNLPQTWAVIKGQPNNALGKRLHFNVKHFNQP